MNIRLIKVLGRLAIKRPRTGWERIKRGISSLLLLYLVLLVFPQLVFAHSLTVRGVTVYSRAALPPEAARLVAETVTLVESSELAAPGRREHIFVCGSPWVFQFFQPLNSGAFAYSVPLVDNIFVADVDFGRNLARSSARRFNTRSFSGVAAHEITHGLIRRRLGLLRGMRVPRWIAEGYCDYVARESSFPESEGLRLMASGERHESGAFLYFTYRQMIRYLVEDRNHSFEQILARRHDFDAVAAETAEAIRSRAAR